MPDFTVKNAELFDFRQVDEYLEGTRDRAEYFEDLLQARDISKKTFAEVLNVTGDAVAAGLEKQLHNQPVSTGKKIALDSWTRRGRHFWTKVVPVVALAAAVYAGNQISE